MTPGIRVVAAPADASSVARLVAALAPAVAAGQVGSPTTTRQFDGAEEGVVVVLVSWNLLAAGDVFDPSTAAVVARHRIGACRLLLVPLDDTNWDGTPLIDLPVVSVVSGNWVDAVVSAVLDVAPAVSAATPGLMARGRDGGPNVPAYADETARRAGESLFAWMSLAQAGGAVDVRAMAAATVALRRGSRLRPGEFLESRFRLLRQTGSLPTEDVWRATDIVGRRPIRVRVFTDAWTDSTADVDALVESTRRLSRLDEAGIIRPIAAGRTEDGFVWQATEPEKHGALVDRANRPMAVLQAGLEVAQTLERCHALGVVHGAVTPNQIVFDADGRALLTHFAPPAALSGRARGGVFEPPEAHAGRAVGQAGDVYALGLSVVAVLHGEELPLWALRGIDRLIGGLPVSERVRRMLATATDWDPDRRGDAKAFAQALLDDADLLTDLAMQAVQSGRSSVAVSHLERLLALRPATAAAVRLQVGELYLQLGDVAAAEGHLHAALRASDDPAPVMTRLKVLAAKTGGWSALVDVLRSAIRAADAPHRSGPLRAELADLYETVLEQPEAAVEVWSAVVDDHRNPVLARRALAALVGHAGRLGDATVLRKYGELFVRLSPDSVAAARDVARAWDHIGDTDQALRWFETAAGSMALTEEDRQRLDTLRLSRGRWREAVASAVRSGDAASLGRAAWVAFDAGDADIARDLATSWLRLAPKSRQAQTIVASEARLRWRTADAVAAGRSEISADPSVDSTAERARLGRLLLQQGSWDEAYEVVTQRTKADHVGCLFVEAAVRSSRGDPAAVSTWTRLVALVDGSAVEVEAWLGLGDAAWMAGDNDVAVSAFRSALVADPSNANAVWGLSRVALSGHSAWALPGRVSPCEPLARLLALTVRRDALEQWLRSSPWGAAVADQGTSSHRMALAASDLVARHGRVSAVLRRIAERVPSAAAGVLSVEVVLEGHPLDDRTAVALPDRPWPGPPCAAWEDLVAAMDPAGPAALVADEASLVCALIHDGATRGALFPGMDGVVLGAAPGATVVSDSDQLMPRHARMWRAADLVYIEALEGGVEVNGRPVGVSRILSGDILVVGGARLEVRTFVDEEDLPPVEVVAASLRRRADSDVSDERTDERQARVQMLAAPPALGSVQLTGELEIRSGPQRGRRQRVAEAVTVGAGPGNVVRLTSDDEVDDLHFEIRQDGARFVLALRSTRGLLVSGRPGRDGMELTGGEVLMAGRTVLAFKVRAASTAR